ncbi:MAG TPA: Spy/CpxP family protein refolding chaperone [Thermoanaerobaculia bacterium]|nr:Spy/CpxP family protein refolding chaperone [Thermoanaerobaculia bacterium]
MKKLSIKQLAPMVAMLLTLGVTVASAGDFGGRGHRGMGGGWMRGLSQLDLSETQKADIRRIMESRHAALESLRERFQADRDALKAAADSPSADPAAVGAAYLRVRANGETMRAERQKTMEEVRAVLTNEQREKFDTMKQNMKERRGKFGRGKAGRSKLNT